MQLAGHIKVLGGPYVDCRPDVAQACIRGLHSLNGFFLGTIILEMQIANMTF